MQQIRAQHESPTEGRAIRQNFISEIKMRWDTKSRQNHGIHRTNYFIKAHSIFITRQRHYRTNNISLEDALGKKCIRKCIKKQYCGCSQRRLMVTGRVRLMSLYFSIYALNDALSFFTVMYLTVVKHSCTNLEIFDKSSSYII